MMNKNLHHFCSHLLEIAHVLPTYKKFTCILNLFSLMVMEDWVFNKIGPINFFSLELELEFNLNVSQLFKYICKPIFFCKVSLYPTRTRSSLCKEVIL